MKPVRPKEALNLKIDAEVKRAMKVWALDHGITVSAMVEAWSKFHLPRPMDDPAAPRRKKGGAA